MVASILTDKLIEAGKELLDQLDSSGIRVSAALWYLFTDSETWKLMLSFPNIEKEGPKSAYSKVQKALLKTQEKRILELDDIVIIKIRRYSKPLKCYGGGCAFYK